MNVVYFVEIPIRWHHTDRGTLRIWFTPTTATEGTWHCEFHTGKRCRCDDGRSDEVPELSLDGLYRIENNDTVLRTWEPGTNREAVWDFRRPFTIRSTDWSFQVDLQLGWHKGKEITNGRSI